MISIDSNTDSTESLPPVRLHFAHANGFPASSYKKLWQFFPKHFEVLAHEQFGHDHRFPVNDNWQNQVDELIHFLQRSGDVPVYLVGHSFGGVISFLVSCQRPDLVKGLIMLDPPIMVGLMSHVFRFLKKTPLIDRVTPSGKSKIRKIHWDDHSQVLDYFKPKALFKHFDPVRNIPHNLNLFKSKLSAPAKLFTAQHTNACFPPMVRRLLKQHPSMEHQLIPGVGHMFPLERPEMTAQLITETINRWEVAD